MAARVLRYVSLRSNALNSSMALSNSLAWRGATQIIMSGRHNTRGQLSNPHLQKLQRLADLELGRDLAVVHAQLLDRKSHV